MFAAKQDDTIDSADNNFHCQAIENFDWLIANPILKINKITHNKKKHAEREFSMSIIALRVPLKRFSLNKTKQTTQNYVG